MLVKNKKLDNIFTKHDNNNNDKTHCWLGSLYTLHITESNIYHCLAVEIIMIVRQSLI